MRPGCAAAHFPFPGRSAVPADRCGAVFSAPDPSYPVSPIPADLSSANLLKESRAFYICAASCPQHSRSQTKHLFHNRLCYPPVLYAFSYSGGAGNVSSIGIQKRTPGNASRFVTQGPQTGTVTGHRSETVSHGGRSGAGESRCLFPELSLRGMKKASGPLVPKAFTLEKSTPSAMEGQAAGRTWRPYRVSLLALRPTLSRGLLFSIRYAVLPGPALRSGAGNGAVLFLKGRPFRVCSGIISQ